MLGQGNGNKLGMGMVHGMVQSSNTHTKWIGSVQEYKRENPTL